MTFVHQQSTRACHRRISWATAAACALSISVGSPRSASTTVVSEPTCQQWGTAAASPLSTVVTSSPPSPHCGIAPRKCARRGRTSGSAAEGFLPRIEPYPGSSGDALDQFDFHFQFEIKLLSTVDLLFQFAILIPNCSRRFPGDRTRLF